MEETFEEIVKPTVVRLSGMSTAGLPITLSPEEARRVARLVAKLAEIADQQDFMRKETWRTTKMLMATLAGLGFWVVTALMFN